MHMYHVTDKSCIWRSKPRPSRPLDGMVRPEEIPKTLHAPPAEIDAEAATGQHVAQDRDELLNVTLGRFRSFDVSMAKCFDESQRQHLLGVIESSFGSFDVFNSIVRHSFANKLEELLVDTAHSAAATRHGTKKGAALRPSGRQLTQKV